MAGHPSRPGDEAIVNVMQTLEAGGTLLFATLAPREAVANNPAVARPASV